MTIGWVLFAVFPFSVTLWSYNNFNGFPANVCLGSPPYKVSGIATFALLVGIILLCTWRLVKVHDAYYVKSELKLIGIVTLIFVVPGFALTFVPSIVQYGK